MEISIHKQFHLTGHKGSVYALCAIDGNKFLSAGSEGFVVEWNLHDTSMAEAIAKVNGQAFAMYFHPLTNKLWCGCMDGSLHVIDLKEKKEVHASNNNTDSIFDITYLPERNLFAAATKLGVIMLFDENFSLKQFVNITDSSLRAFAQHPSNHHLAIAASDNAVHLYDKNTMLPYMKIIDASHSIFSVAYTNDGNYLIAGSRDACLYVYDVNEDYELVKKIKAHLYTINHISMHPDGEVFFTAGRDKHIKIWDAETFALLKVIDFEKNESHTNSVNKLLWLADDNLLISASDDRSIIGWRIEIENNK